MGRHMRIQDPDFIYHITNRTQEAKFLFVPDDEMNDLAYDTLCMAVQIFDIELYAAVLMANHPHLMLRAPHLNLHRFMEYYQTRLSRGVNRHRKRLDACVFPERYSSEPILDPESLLEKMAYVLCNPVAANLVARPEEYPGLTTYRQCAGLAELRPLPLTRLPYWAELDEDQVQARYRRLVEPTVARCERERNWPVMGADRVRGVDWWKRPKRPKRGSKAVCHGSTKLVRRQYADFVDRCQTRYRTALLAHRRGDYGVPFPYGMVPPGRTECSRSEAHRRAPRALRAALFRQGSAGVVCPNNLVE